MVLVRVHRVTSVTDPETGKPGKQIELVEVRQRRDSFGMFGVGEEAQIVKNVLSQFQAFGLFPHMREMILPKITLFLTEDEYDMLGVRFEVNETFDLVFKDGTIRLEKPEGV
jgi:hypothetical protein